ncbi:MAG TPA: FHA domain-containing protein [Acidimicrobiales bacterium]
MPEQLLGLLKLCLLALLYLFLARVLWAVWTEVRAVRPQTEGASPLAGPGTSAAAGAAAGRSSAASRRGHRQPAGVPHRLTIAQPPSLRGGRFELSGPELTIGRAIGCHISLPDDTFASTLHARVFTRDGAVYVEDLGSTNGTYLNGMQLAAPAMLRPSDQLQVGNTVMDAS